MDLRKIKTLIELLEASDLSEIEINEGDDYIRLSRHSSAQVMPVAAPVAPMMAPPVAAVPPASADAAPAAETAIAGHAVESPTVGTFYARPSPDADAFVKIGDSVAVGATLCVVEAMKTFNEIQADKAGTIIDVLKTDGDPVEYGEALFIIA